jgi:hypothetical protein
MPHAPTEGVNATFQSDAAIQKELAYLYDRRSTLKALIRSLERYDRHRQRNPPIRVKRNPQG